MTTRDLIDAIAGGNASEIQKTFEQTMAIRIADKLDAMKTSVAQNMFKESADEEIEESVDVEQVDEAAGDSVHPQAIHVKHVGNGKYKVHAVGKDFQHGIKPGEHLSDTELDDFQEMGGKIKHVKEDTASSNIKQIAQQYQQKQKDDIKKAGGLAQWKDKVRNEPEFDYAKIKASQNK